MKVLLTIGAAVAVAVTIAMAQTAITVTVSTPKQEAEVIALPADPAIQALRYTLAKAPAANTLLLVFYDGRFLGAFKPVGPEPRVLDLTLPTSRSPDGGVTVVYWSTD